MVPDVDGDVADEGDHDHRRGRGHPLDLLFQDRTPATPPQRQRGQTRQRGAHREQNADIPKVQRGGVWIADGVADEPQHEAEHRRSRRDPPAGGQQVTIWKQQEAEGQRQEDAALDQDVRDVLGNPARG